MTSLRALAGALALSFIFAGPVACLTETDAYAANDAALSATVISVDGKGVAKLRRKAGTEVTLAMLQQLNPGDKITTDDKTVVQVSLTDGTIVRIGINSEYRIESARRDGSFMSWVFSLARGSIRALVEKGVAHKDSKFRINTPAGTMGVRGTEIVLEHDPRTNITTLRTLEGKVGFGALDCEKQKSCVEVKTGEGSTIKVGDLKPSDPKAFQMEEIIKEAMGNLKAANQGKGAALTPEEAAALAARLSVLAPMNELGKDLALLDDAALLKGAQKAGEELARLQDSMMNRDAATREAMERAARDGTLEDRLALGQKLNGKTDVGSEADTGTGNVKNFQKAAEYEAQKASGKKDAAADDLLAKIKAKEKASGSGKVLNAAALAASKLDADALMKKANERLAQTVRQRNDAEAAGKKNEAAQLAAQAEALAKQIEEDNKRRKAEEDRLAAEAEERAQAEARAKAAQAEADAKAKNTAAAPSGGSGGVCASAKNDPTCQMPAVCNPYLLSCRYTQLAWEQWCGNCDREGSNRNTQIAGVAGAVEGVGNAVFFNPFASTPARRCYKAERTCENQMVPCDLSKGKKCTPTYQVKCQDKQIEIPCR